MWACAELAKYKGIRGGEEAIQLEDFCVLHTGQILRKPVTVLLDPAEGDLM